MSVRQFQQQVLPAGMPATTVFGFGAPDHGWSTFSYPARTIEVAGYETVDIEWVNELKDQQSGRYLPHLFAVDQTLHW